MNILSALEHFSPSIIFTGGWWHSGTMNTFLSMVRSYKADPKTFMALVDLPLEEQAPRLLAVLKQQENHVLRTEHSSRLPSQSGLAKLLKEVANIDDFSLFADEVVDYYEQFGALFRPAYDGQRITALMLALTKHDTKKQVFIPSASLGQLGWGLNAEKLELTEYYRSLADIGKKLMAIKGVTGTYSYMNDLLDPDQIPKNADLVLITPEYHPKFTAKELVKLEQVNYKLLNVENAKYTMEALWLQFGLFHTHAQGKVLLALPTRFLDKGSYDAKIKKMIIDEDWIESVIKLPTDLFSWRRNVSSVIITLNKNKDLVHKGFVSFIDATALTLSADDMVNIANAALNPKVEDKTVLRVPLSAIKAAKYSLNQKRYSLEEI